MTCRLIVVLTSLLLSVPTGISKFAGDAFADGIDLMVTVALCAAAMERLASIATAEKIDFMVADLEAKQQIYNLREGSV